MGVLVMRVAMFHGDLPRPGRKPGGVAVHVHRLSEALVRRGHDVTVMTFSPASEATYDVSRLRPHFAETSTVAREYIVPWLFNMRSFVGFDVAHFHGDDWFYFRRTLPTVRTFHGSALREAQHAASWRRRIDKAVVFPLEILASKLATGSYAVGPDEEHIYHALGLLPIGIDAVAEPEHRSTSPTILFVGTWSGRKRGEFLYDVFRREVLPRVSGAELWMVADECPENVGVKWIRAPSDGELSALLSRAWVFCLPSAYEGFGIPYLEAMAHGTPVVATPNPGSNAVLDNGSFGMLTTDDRLGETLVTLLEDASLRESLAASGRQRAGDYSWDRSCVRHEEAYARAIGLWESRRGRTRRRRDRP